MCKGDVFGKNTMLHIVLLDISAEAIVKKLKAIQLEIQDCVFPLVYQVDYHTDCKEAFKDIDYCVMLGAFPRGPQMERKDLLQKNAGIFKEQAVALDNAKKSCKVLVVGNPANNNCLILCKNNTTLPKHNFTALTMLDHQRLQYQVANALNIQNPTNVKKVVIFGNHSNKQFPCTDFAENRNGKKLGNLLTDEQKSKIVPTCQTRGAEIIKLRQLSSAASAAEAVMNHLNCWHFGTRDWVSFGIYCTGE